MVQTLVATTLALVLTAGGCSARKRNFDDIKNNIHSEGYKRPVVHHNSGTTYAAAGVKCSSTGWAGHYSKSVDSYAVAVADAVASVCTYDDGYDKALHIMTGWAEAYAAAAAKATAECKSYEYNGGKAEGCSYAKGYAVAAAHAHAEVHAHATAEAYAESCYGCSYAAAWAFGDAELMIDLFAYAEAYAQATACATGNHHASATAYTKCYSKIYAKTIAIAAARAVAIADCEYSYLGPKVTVSKSYADARTDILAFVAAKIENEEKCVYLERDYGYAGAEVDGYAYTGSDTGH